MATAWPGSGSARPFALAGGGALALSRRGRMLAWLSLAFWLSNFALLTLTSALAGNEHLTAVTGMRALAMLFGLLLCYAIHRALNRPALSTLRRRIVALAIMAPIAAESFAWVMFFAEAAVDPSLDLGNFSWGGAVRTISFWTWFFLAWAGAYLAVGYHFDVQEERRRSAELQREAHVAQLRALHSQINPHFLFNSLNSVSALILDGKAAEAEEMVTRLARFLRQGLAVDATRTIALASEIELQRAYLEIEQLRFPDLDVAVSLPGELEDAKVPALILQPIVENAVKYGVAGAPPPTWIAIAARREGERLTLEVTDSGSRTQLAAPGAGIGLANVGERLRLLYGDDQSLERERREDGSFHVKVTLPLQSA
jgi:two-component system, LytTR family, sensor kinase